MLKLFNTISRRLEEFAPIDPDHVGLYTCGPTVYNYVHLGNLRTYIFEDVLRRALELNRFKVKHVMNITDVGHLTSDADTGDDKMEASARTQGKNARQLAAFYTEAFKQDLQHLNILPAHVMPTATGTIDLQIKLIQRLEKNGFTYRTSDGIYFDTAKFPNYGKLSGQKLVEKLAGARIEVDAHKRHQTDFALWKFSPQETKRQMEWDSPWGVGFPGWHIECSAMSMHELGEQFDLHTGGIDHIAVHHENEIAQSEAATGKTPFVKYWLHGEFLVLPDKRMGKSEGNFITLQSLTEKAVHPLAYRYLVLQTHYRSPLTFSWDALQAAQTGLLNLWLQIDTNQGQAAIGCAEFESRFLEAVNDDLNTPKALAVLHEMIKSDYPWSAKLKSLISMDHVVGLGLTKDFDRPHFQPLNQTLEKKVLALVRERETARQQKNFEKSDDLRNQINTLLEKSGFTLEDTLAGPKIVPAGLAALTRDSQPRTL